MMYESCFCDGDPAEFYYARRPLARKAHECYECGGPINTGERYEYVFGKWDDISIFKTCVYCLKIRDLLHDRLPCFCWVHGELGIGVQAVMGDIKGDNTGLRMAVGRIEVDRRRAK